MQSSKTALPELASLNLDTTESYRSNLERYFASWHPSSRPPVGLQFISTQNKFFDYQSLKSINSNSVRAGRNRLLYFERLPISDNSIIFLSWAAVHNNHEIRVGLDFSFADVSAKEVESMNGLLLDMSVEDFQSLPEEEDDDGYNS